MGMGNTDMLCPECAHVVSKRATKCPNCGRTFTQWYVVVLAVIGAILLIAAISGQMRENRGIDFTTQGDR